jgi:excinuclease ABC subunit A
MISMPISIEGAREHNLKSVDLEIGDGITVVTGVSGSGKSSLVFDTLYHESRRRYLEAFGRPSATGSLVPAAVDRIMGLGPAVLVGQNVLNRNPNSTVASASGLHPLFRLLFSRFGTRNCPECGEQFAQSDHDEIVGEMYQRSRGQRITVWRPVIHDVSGSHQALMRLLESSVGKRDLRVDGKPLSDAPLGAPLDPARTHSIDLRIGVLGPESTKPDAARLLDVAIEAGGTWITLREGRSSRRFSFAPVCWHCGRWFSDVEPKHFHTPCPLCGGSGLDGATACKDCGGSGIWPDAASTRWEGLTFVGMLKLSIDVALKLCVGSLAKTGTVLSEIVRRLEALDRVQLGYIGLDRPSPSLSRGESQRLRLAMALTSRLDDMLHILDEPTIGQHPHDVSRLLPAFRELPGPVVFVEHDRTAAAYAGDAIDLGPGAGESGGQITYSGPIEGLLNSETPTGRYFSLRETVQLPAQRSSPEAFLTVTGASARNLKSIDVSIPKGRLTVISGVSGSGKSTLVRDVLFASLKTGEPVGCAHVSLDGVGKLPVPVFVDQSPIGTNPRSNPATYTKIADDLRACFAAATGLPASYFTFNRSEGACANCSGLGSVEIKMRYLPSTWLECPECSGQRFSEEVLAQKAEISGHSYSISQAFDLPVSEFASLLSADEVLPDLERRRLLRTLGLMQEVGLGYMRIGQPSPSMSGGEAQRIKLVKFMTRKKLTNTVMLLDEPSTGLHPQDTAGLLLLFDRLVRAGATIVVIEHNTDIIRAADWLIDLGPGAGDRGGKLLYSGPPDGITSIAESRTGCALSEDTESVPAGSEANHPKPSGDRKTAQKLSIFGARANNLDNVSVDIPKDALTVITGVSGSGKSSLVYQVLEAEAKRRFLESLSFYERQSVREGPRQDVERVSGLGVTFSMGAGRARLGPRSDCGALTGIAEHLAVLFAAAGERLCAACGKPMTRKADGWMCAGCGSTRPADQPNRFLPSTYASACTECHGVGSMQIPSPAKLIVRPDLPLCGGAMHSPGFFPKGYLCKPFNGGYYLVQAIAERYGFEPAQTPWCDMSEEAQDAFLYGDPDPVEVHSVNRKGKHGTNVQTYPGFYGWIRDWDVGGTYTDMSPCPSCGGARLRPEYLEVELFGANIHRCRTMTLAALADHMAKDSETEFIASGLRNAYRHSLQTVRSRFEFLKAVGLGYLSLNQPSSTLSAGEAQRLRLAGLLGGDMSSLTVILDEPCRGMHPREVLGLVGALRSLRDQGNTVIVIEHELDLIRAADFLIELGPGPGRHGGQVMYAGHPDQIPADTATGSWLRNGVGTGPPRLGREPMEDLPDRRAWHRIVGADENCLRRIDVEFPPARLIGVCGVSGSGKSTLLIDTLGRALAPRKHTTSVSQELLEPGKHDRIENCPDLCVIVDQAKTGVATPADFLGLEAVFRKLYSEDSAFKAAGLNEADLKRRCSACGGRGYLRTDLAFLPALVTPCEACAESGYSGEILDITVRGHNLAELHSLTIDEAISLWGDHDVVNRPLQWAQRVGLGYLLLRQPSHSLSGGESQRLKIARELGKKKLRTTLYLLDEPTVGLHMDDTARLLSALRELTALGHTVIVIEHHAGLLAACDWLVELGPGGGPNGGVLIGEGPPSHVAGLSTPTAPYIRESLQSLEKEAIP